MKHTPERKGLLALGIGAAVCALMVLVIEAWLVVGTIEIPPRDLKGVLVLCGFVLTPLVWGAFAALPFFLVRRGFSSAPVVALVRAIVAFLAGPAAGLTGLLLFMGNRTDPIEGMVIGGTFLVLGLTAETALMVGGFMAFFSARRAR